MPAARRGACMTHIRRHVAAAVRGNRWRLPASQKESKTKANGSDDPRADASQPADRSQPARPGGDGRKLCGGLDRRMRLADSREENKDIGIAMNRSAARRTRRGRRGGGRFRPCRRRIDAIGDQQVGRGGSASRRVPVKADVLQIRWRRAPNRRRGGVDCTVARSQALAAVRTHPGVGLITAAHHDIYAIEDLAQ